MKKNVRASLKEANEAIDYYDENILFGDCNDDAEKKCSVYYFYGNYNLSKKDAMEFSTAMVISFFDKSDLDYALLYFFTPNHGIFMSFCRKADERFIFDCVIDWKKDFKDAYVVLRKFPFTKKYKPYLDRSYLPFVRKIFAESNFEVHRASSESD